MAFDWRRFVFALLVLLIISLSAFLGSHYTAGPPPGQCPPCLSEPSSLHSPQPPHDRVALVPHEIMAESCSQNPACQKKWAELNAQNIWRSQGGQDKWVYEHIFWKKSEPGIYVEFGARNGESDSNTYFYEKIGWKGLLAEIAPNEIAGIKDRRKGALVLHGAICNKRGMVDFKINDQVAGLSGQLEHDTNRFPHYSKTVTKVPCYTLNEVLNLTGFTKIDYMTVDTEGSEFSILNALDFNRFVITVIQVETINSEVERRRSIDALLLSKGYKIIHTVDLGLDTLDVIYFRTPQADLLNFDKLLQDGWPASFLQKY